MTYLVKIKRETIRSNPNAGRTEHIVPGPASMTISGKFIVHGRCSPDRKDRIFTALEEFFQENDCLINWLEIVPSRGVIPGEEVGDFSGAPLRILTNDECKSFGINLMEKLDGLKCTMPSEFFKIETHREVHRVRTLTPEPSYLFAYEEAIVKCEECGAEFVHDEFESDYMPDGVGDEIWSNRICPKCGYWDCCETEYENLTNEMIAAAGAQ